MYHSLEVLVFNDDYQELTLKTLQNPEKFDGKSAEARKLSLKNIMRDRKRKDRRFPQFPEGVEVYHQRVREGLPPKPEAGGGIVFPSRNL